MSTEVAPALVPEPGFDIWAAWEEALALPPKARGEVAEMILVPMLMAMGFIVAKPFGESAPWDLVVQVGETLSRLQVKSAWVKGTNGYQVSAGPSFNARTGCRRHYRPNEIDFLVAYIALEDAWFVIPVRKIRCATLSLDLAPDSPWAQYRDRWDLLYDRR